jgi:hypothetical protein
MNYATRLSAYNFTILYRKGSSNANADVLSRYPVIPLKGKSEPSKEEKIEVLAVNHAPEDENMDLSNNLLLLQNRNPLFRALRIYLENGKIDPHLQEYTTDVKSSAHLYTIGPNGELRRLNKDNVYVICLPLELRGLVLHDAHDTGATAHCGREKMVYRITRDYWWPTIYRDVENYIRRCVSCQKYKRSRVIIQPLGTKPEAERVWERVHMDIWSPGSDSLSHSGNKYVLAIVDYVTKFLVAEPISDRNADTIANVLVKRIICPYGPPDEIISDGAAEFRSQLVSVLHQAFGITRKITTPYRPQANGIIERVFATIRPMLGTMVEKCPRRWDEFLPYVIHAYNTSFHRSVKNTPFYLFYGRDPALGIKGLDGIINDPSHMDLNKRIRILIKARSVALQHIKEENLKRKLDYDKNAKPYPFEEGNIVMLKSIRPPGVGAPKLYPWFVGPYRIDRIMNDRVLSVTPVGYPNAKPKIIHADRARLSEGECIPNPNIAELVSPFADPSFIDPALEPESEES